VPSHFNWLLTLKEDSLAFQDGSFGVGLTMPPFKDFNCCGTTNGCEHSSGGQGPNKAVETNDGGRRNNVINSTSKDIFQSTL
jgi:hypothetical protein